MNARHQFRHVVFRDGRHLGVCRAVLRDAVSQAQRMDSYRVPPSSIFRAHLRLAASAIERSLRLLTQHLGRRRYAGETFSQSIITLAAPLKD
jgi:arylamine N-acetyltransferase